MTLKIGSASQRLAAHRELKVPVSFLAFHNQPPFVGVILMQAHNPNYAAPDCLLSVQFLLSWLDSLKTG
jgi:hypothetical protein